MSTLRSGPGRRRSPSNYARRLLYAGDARRFWRVLRSDQRGSTLRALIDGPVVFATMNRRGLRPLVTKLPTQPSADVRQARLVSEAVDAGLAMWPLAFTCLRRSVVLLRELDRRRMGAELTIGVRRGPEGLEAHAWVQVGDAVINDQPEVVQTYAVIPLGEADSLYRKFT